MTRRCDGWDYRARAIYQITLVQADRRRPALGRLVIDDPAAAPEAVAARVEPSALGAAILAHWKRLGDFTPEIRPLFCQLMPDHLHGILEVTRPMAKTLGNAIGGFKTGCEKIYRGLAPSAPNKAVGAGFGLAVLAGEAKGGAARSGLAGGAACPVPEASASGLPRLWASGFQDSILFRAGQLDAMFSYLRDNPRRLAAGRLLLLAPAAWPHVPGEKPMTRRDALVLNRLAQALAGDGAAEISYRGVTFAEVEAWARAAVKDPAGARRGVVV